MDILIRPYTTQPVVSPQITTYLHTEAGEGLLWY